MTTWLDTIRRAAEDAASPVEVFMRDDDAGRADDALIRLLTLFADRGLAIDLAVIPAAISEAMAAQLRAMLSSHPQIGIHQHGYTHVNHEPSGRKYEFGPSRDAFHQLNDIRNGNARLTELFGSRLDPIFTPPWNRCTGDTVKALTTERFQILSRNATAERFAFSDLQHLPVTVDWQRARNGVRLARRRIAEGLADQIRAGKTPIGLMLHHETLDSEDWRDLVILAEFLASMPALRPRRMIEFSSKAT